MGNRLTLDSSVAGTTTYTYDAADRIVSMTAGAATTTFDHDNNGNMTRKGSANYSFDALDRLTQVTDGASSVLFAYDGDGTRLSKTATGVTTNYVQDTSASLPVVLTEAVSGSTNRYVYGSDLISQLDSTAAISFYHTDGLGSTRALSSAAGQRTNSYSYDVFGAQRAQTGGSSQPFTFTGEQIDAETNLMFLRARYYDAEIGRFISGDKFPAIEDLSITLNRYIYTGQNPVNHTDPSGEFFCTLLGLRSACQILAAGPDAPPAQLPEIPNFALDIADAKGVIPPIISYVYDWYDGIKTGDLFFDEDINAAKGVHELLKETGLPLIKAFPNAIRNCNNSGHCGQMNILESLRSLLPNTTVYAAEHDWDMGGLPSQPK